MNKNAKLYFDHHPKVTVFHFTSDGGCFFTKEQATAHAAALEKKNKGTSTVKTVSRAQMNEWWKEEAPKVAAACEKALGEAREQLKTAKEKLAALPKKVSDAVYMNVNKAVKKAENVVAIAEAEFDKSVKEIPEDATVTPDAEKSGSDDLVPDGDAKTTAEGEDKTPAEGENKEVLDEE